MNTACRAAFALILMLCLLPGRSWAEDFPKPDAEGTVEVSLQTTNQTLIVFLSGDGGWWGDLDAQLARDLAAHGYAVLGLDTGVWFDSARQPDEVSARIGGMIRDFRSRTKLRHVTLIGYSFGADMVPLIYNRLAKAERSLVSGLVLISPGRMASLQVTLPERAGLTEGTLDLAPELKRLPGSKTRCIYGTDEETDTGCTLAVIKPQIRIGLPGGHHYNNDVARLSEIVVKAADAFIRPGPSILRW